TGVSAGTNVACPKCKQKFAVNAPKAKEVEAYEDFEVVDDNEQETREVPTRARAGRKANDEEIEAADYDVADEVEEDAPRAKSSPPDRRRDENDESPERSTKRKERRAEVVKQERPRARGDRNDDEDMPDRDERPYDRRDGDVQR